MVRAIFHSFFDGWSWYNQLLLFGGAFFVILGLLVFFVMKYGKAIAKTKAALIKQVEPISDKQRELSDYYERQIVNWKGNLRLRIIHVKPDLTSDVPKVVFEMEMINHLPFEIKLAKVARSSGTVSAGILGSCALPALPTTIDRKIRACSETPFTLEMEIGGTKAPDFLPEKLTEPGQLLQWTLKGEWYVEIEGKQELWETQSYQLSYDQIIVRKVASERRGM